MSLNVYDLKILSKPPTVSQRESKVNQQQNQGDESVRGSRVLTCAYASYEGSPGFGGWTMRSRASWPMTGALMSMFSRIWATIITAGSTLTSSMYAALSPHLMGHNRRNCGERGSETCTSCSLCAHTCRLCEKTHLQYFSYTKSSQPRFHLCQAQNLSSEVTTKSDEFWAKMRICMFWSGDEE